MLQRMKWAVVLGLIAAGSDKALSADIKPPWTGDYDLVNGLVGYAVYAFQRLPNRSAIACLERVINHLADTAEHRAEGSP